MKTVHAKSIIRKSILVLSLVLLASCNYERIKETPLSAKAPSGPIDPERIPSWYSELEAQIFHSKTCYGCHGPNGKSGIPIYEYDQVMGYVEPGKPDESILYIYLRDGEMPKGPNKITGKLLEGVRKWIESGAKEKGDGEP